MKEADFQFTEVTLFIPNSMESLFRDHTLNPQTGPCAFFFFFFEQFKILHLLNIIFNSPLILDHTVCLLYFRGVIASVLQLAESSKTDRGKATQVDSSAKKKKKKTLRLTCHQSGIVPRLKVCVEAGPGQVGGATVTFLYKEDPSVKKPQEENR